MERQRKSAANSVGNEVAIETGADVYIETVPTCAVAAVDDTYRLWLAIVALVASSLMGPVSWTLILAINNQCVSVM